MNKAVLCQFRRISQCLLPVVYVFLPAVGMNFSADDTGVSTADAGIFTGLPSAPSTVIVPSGPGLICPLWTCAIWLWGIHIGSPSGPMIVTVPKYRQSWCFFDKTETTSRGGNTFKALNFSLRAHFPWNHHLSRKQTLVWLCSKPRGALFHPQVPFFIFFVAIKLSKINGKNLLE